MISASISCAATIATASRRKSPCSVDQGLGDDLSGRHALALGHRGAPFVSRLGRSTDESGARGGRNFVPDPTRHRYTTSTDVTELVSKSVACIHPPVARAWAAAQGALLAEHRHPFAPLTTPAPHLHPACASGCPSLKRLSRPASTRSPIPTTSPTPPTSRDSTLPSPPPSIIGSPCSRSVSATPPPFRRP